MDVGTNIHPIDGVFGSVLNVSPLELPMADQGKY